MILQGFITEGRIALATQGRDPRRRVAAGCDTTHTALAPRSMNEYTHANDKSSDRAACKAARQPCKDRHALPARISANHRTAAGWVVAQIPRLVPNYGSVAPNTAAEGRSKSARGPILQALQLWTQSILQGSTPRILQGGVGA